jgi:hypothetical protein
MNPTQYTEKPQPVEPIKPKHPIYREMWALVYPSGRIVADPEMCSEESAWQVGLCFPYQQEIENLKRVGVFAVKVRIRYFKPAQ